MKRAVDLAKRPVSVPLGAMLVLILIAATGPFWSVKIAVHQAEESRRLADRENAQAAKTAAAAVTKAQLEARKVVCGWIDAFLDTYDETPPESDAGRNLQAKFIDLRAVSQCQPTRK